MIPPPHTCTHPKCSWDAHMSGNPLASSEMQICIQQLGGHLSSQLADAPDFSKREDYFSNIWGALYCTIKVRHYLVNRFSLSWKRRDIKEELLVLNAPQKALIWWPNGDQHIRYLSISSAKNQVAGEKGTSPRLMPKDANVIEQVRQLLEPLSTFTDFLASETRDTVSHHACPKLYKPWCSGGKRCGIISDQGNGKGDKNRHTNKAKSIMHMVCFNDLLLKTNKFFASAWSYRSCI